MNESESVESTPDVGDVLGIGEPSATEAAPQAEASTESSAEPVQAQEPVTDQPVAYEAEQPVANAPTPPTIRIGDRDYTAQEVAAWQTTAQQFSHLQKKYVEALESQKQQPTPQTSAPQQAMTPQSYMAALRHQYDPVTKDLAEKGYLSNDFVTLFPTEAAQLVHYQNRYQQLEQKVNQLDQGWTQRTQQEQQNGLVNAVGRSISALAQSGEAFAPLKDPQNVQKFFNYLWELNPQVSQLQNPDFLARQYVAYNKDQFLQSAQKTAVQTQRSQAARLARADATGGARAPGVMSQPAQTPLDEMWDDHLERNR